MAGNQAAYLDGVGQRLRVGPADMPKPANDEILIRNHAAAINPLDWKMQDMGLFVQKYPAVFGLDMAGEVVEVGAGVSDFTKGDRVMAQGAALSNPGTGYGAYQLFAAVPATKATKIPSNVSYNEAVVFPVAFDTASLALFGESDSLGLPHPTLEPKPSGKTIVVWGGSSSVGALALQLARAAGVKVITTASTHNIDFCKTHGASEVFDYKNSSVVEDVVQAIKASDGEFAGIFDTISLPDQSQEQSVSILERFGGGALIGTLFPPKRLPDNVRYHMVHGENSPVGVALRRSFLGPAIEKGKLRAVPEPLVVGNGLEWVQEGFDRSKKGVSAKKLVVEL